MNNAKLLLHYKYLIPITLLQIVTTILALLIMTPDEYGMYTLYFTTINMMYLVTLGSLEGYIIKNRTLEKAKIKGVHSFINTFAYIQLIVTICIFVIIKLFSAESIYLYAIVGSYAMNLYQLALTIFKNVNDAHKQNRLIIMSRLIFLIDVIIMFFTKNVIVMFTIDMLLRFILVFYALKHLKKEYQVNSLKTNTYRDYIQSGFLIMIANTIFTLTLMLNKFALANNIEMLGTYSMALTLVLFTRIATKPLTQVLFVVIDENQQINGNQINILQLISGMFALITIIVLFLNYLVHNVNIFVKFTYLMPICIISVLIIPLMPVVEAILINLNRHKNKKMFLHKSLIIFIIYSLLLFIYTRFLNVDLLVFATIDVIAYFIAYTVYSIFVIDWKQYVKYTSVYLIGTTIYVIIISLMIT